MEYIVPFVLFDLGLAAFLFGAIVVFDMFRQKRGERTLGGLALLMASSLITAGLVAMTAGVSFYFHVVYPWFQK